MACMKPFRHGGVSRAARHLEILNRLRLSAHCTEKTFAVALGSSPWLLSFQKPTASCFRTPDVQLLGFANKTCE